MPFSYSSTLTIQELGSDGSTVLRAAILKGPGLPFMGAGWPFQNTLKTTWYPGNQDEATQQVMGRRELPSRWSGEWNVTRFARAPSRILDVAAGTGGQDVYDPFTLYTFLDSVFSSGRRLRVTWNTTQQPVSSLGTGETNDAAISVNVSIVREGRCAQFTPKFQSVFDIQWEAEFEWVSRGRTTSRVTTPRNASVNDQSSAYAAALDALVQANAFRANATTGPTFPTLGQIEALANTPTLLANEISRKITQVENDLGKIVDIANTIASQPAQIARIAIDHGKNAKALADQNYQELSSLGVETLTTQNDAASVLAAHQTFAQIQQANQQAATAAFTFLQSVRRSLPDHSPPLSGALSSQASADSTTILATYVCKQGDTLHKISMKFYGTADHADDIARANRLSWHTLLVPMGKILLIPELSSISQTTP